MKKTSKLAILLLISPLCLGVTTKLSQAATTGIWTYGESQYDGAICNIGIMDGGHIIVGSTEGYGAVGDDLWLFMTDAMGGMMWNYTYGGPQDDHGWYGVKTPDGYALGGYTYSYGTNGNAAAVAGKSRCKRHDNVEPNLRHRQRLLWMGGNTNR